MALTVIKKKYSSLSDNLTPFVKFVSRIKVIKCIRKYNSIGHFAGQRSVNLNRLDRLNERMNERTNNEMNDVILVNNPLKSMDLTNWFHLT